MTENLINGRFLEVQAVENGGVLNSVTFINDPNEGCIRIYKELTGDVPDDFDGTFEFEVYDNPVGEGDPVATASISFTDGEADLPGYAEICNLSTDMTYYVMETSGAGTNVTEGLENGMLDVIPCQFAPGADADADGDLDIDFDKGEIKLVVGLCIVTFTNNFEG